MKVAVLFNGRFSDSNNLTNAATDAVDQINPAPVKETSIMTKHELILALRASKSLSKTEAVKCVELFFNTMADALEKGERIEIRGLCSFYVKEYKLFTGRNPKTGEKVVVKDKRLPVFRMGTDLKRRVDHGSTFLDR